VTHPRDITADSVRFYALRNLHVLGRRTIGACVGILYPRVIIDRDVESKPGFEALCYHEGTHAYEYHRLIGLCLVAPSFILLGVALVLEVWWLLLALPVGPLAWMWWAREMETRADAVALSGSHATEFRSFLLLVGPQRAWWGRWCYGGTLQERERRARRRCARYGWDIVV